MRLTPLTQSATALCGLTVLSCLLTSCYTTQPTQHPNARAQALRADVREDIYDRREDRWDARRHTGPGDRIEDIYDRREDRADRRWGTN